MKKRIAFLLAALMLLFLPLRGPKPIGTAAALTADVVYVSKLGEKAHAAGEMIEMEVLR